MSKRFLKTFFAEKNLAPVLWEIEASDGMIHMVDSETIIDTILESSDEIQHQIAMKLRQIDFHNGDVSHFLRFLAKGLVEVF
jgi:hypothetical protein